MPDINDNFLSQKLDLLAPHTEHLARMKAQNQSTAEIIAWLRTQGIHKIHGGHLAALWKRRETKSQEAPVLPSPPMGVGDLLPSQGLAPSHLSHPSHPSYMSHGSAASGAQKDRPASPGPSPAQIAANRLNALKSTGPKTAAGKAVSSQNAMKHTALARAMLVFSRSHQESSGDFQALCSEYHDALNPVGPLELMLVEQIVTAVWRQRRVRQAESGEIALNLDHQPETNFKEHNPLDKVADLLESAESGQIEDINTLLADSECGCIYLLGTLNKAYQNVVRDKVLSRETYHTLETNLRHSAPKFTAPLQRMMDERDTNPAKLDPDSLASKHEADVLTYLAGQITHYEAIFKGKRYSGSTALERARKDAALMPSAGALDKILRYETVLEKQIFRAMNQLEKLQHRRLGSYGPATHRKLGNQLPPQVSAPDDVTPHPSHVPSDIGPSPDSPSRPLASISG